MQTGTTNLLVNFAPIFLDKVAKRCLVHSWQPSRNRKPVTRTLVEHPQRVQRSSSPVAPGFTRTTTHATRHCNVAWMDTESQDAPLLSPLPDSVGSIKVFPFIVHLKRDVIVSRRRQLGPPFSLKTFFSLSHTFPSTVWCCRGT